MKSLFQTILNGGNEQQLPEQLVLLLQMKPVKAINCAIHQQYRCVKVQECTADYVQHFKLIS